MNQDQVKEQLLLLEDDVIDFTLIFSGKQSKKAHGLYYPERREIIIHNRNFANDNELMYTAIHEFAHHIHFTTSALPVTNRAHTNEFRRIFNELLEKAEGKSIYKNVFEATADFKELTAKIKSQFIEKNGHLMKEFGKVLIDAEALCRKHGTRFEDYLDRVLGLGRTSAMSIMKMHSFDVNPAIGYEGMKAVTALAKPEERKSVEEALLSGKSPEVVRAAMKNQDKADISPIEELQKEKQRLEKNISNLQTKLQEIETLINEIDVP